jgi:hypothetical protein
MTEETIQPLSFRCIACGARLADLTPPVGGATIKCWKCHEMMTCTIAAEGDVWYVRRWWTTYPEGCSVTYTA